MGGTQSLSKGFVDEFLSFDGPSKAKGLKDLIKLTPYQHQVEVLEYLKEILYKDVVASLPPELTQKVMSFLPFADVLSCLCVNRKWNEVISHREACWERFTLRLGLSRAALGDMLQQYGSVKALCIAGFKQSNRIRALAPATASVSKSPLACSYVYAGNGVLLMYREINGSAEVVVEKAKSHSSVVEVARIAVPSRSGRVKWAAASDRYLLWKQVDGKWIGCSTEEDDPELDQWDDEPAEEGFFSVAFCHRCHLVMMVADAEGDCEVWDAHVVKLRRGSATPRRMVYPVSLERVRPSGESVRRFCLGGRVTLVSEGNERDGTGFCAAHRVLLQVGNCVSVHRLKSVCTESYPLAVHSLMPDAILSKSLRVLTPSHHRDVGGELDDWPQDASDDNLLYTQPTCGAAFCMSRDRSRLGIVYRGCLHVWNLLTCEREACTSLAAPAVGTGNDERHPSWPSDVRCVALGAVYAVLASDASGLCAVVTTHGGEVVMEYRVGEVDRELNVVPEQVAALSSRFSFYGPLHEEWLSSFGCLYPDLWPVSVFFDWEDGLAKGVELKAVVATPACTNRT